MQSEQTHGTQGAGQEVFLPLEHLGQARFHVQNVLYRHIAHRLAGLERTGFLRLRTEAFIVDCEGDKTPRRVCYRAGRR